MNLNNASTQPLFLFLQLKRYWFECLMLLLLALYSGFYCTPSSYGMALNMLGIPNDGLILGTPKAVRSDEWSVWTPYLQALVNNHFQRFNAYSIYHEDFRNFNALPIYDWALLFKPQFWSFLIAEPARAFSFHHGFLIAAFLIGWKQLIAKIIQPYPYASPGIAIGFSLLLFFSGFIQTIWTTMGPIIAFFPWLMLVLLAWRRHSIAYYCLLSYTMAVWLLSHTYPPLVVSMAYVGIMILAAFQTDFFSNIKRCVLSVLACLAGVGIVVYYYKDVIPIMMNTVYPGQRVSPSAEGGAYIWLSTILPYITHSTDKIVPISANVCEATAVSSLLPLMSLCFSRVKKWQQLYRKDFLIFSLAFLFLTAWMLLPLPLLLGKILLLTKIPGNRFVFALGLIINMLALIILVNYGAQLTRLRIAIFTILLICCWNIPAFFSLFNYFDKSAIELITIPLIILLFILWHFKKINAPTTAIILIAALPNFLYFASFNPIQSARPIFTAKNSDTVKTLEKLAQEDSRGWLVFPGVPAAIMNGLGLKSFTHTLIQPQLAFFKKLFPEIPDITFNKIFNRYAHIHVYDIQQPYSPALDVIAIPIGKIIQKRGHWQEIIEHTNCQLQAAQNGHLDGATLDKRTLYLGGWVMGNEHHYLTNLRSSKLVRYIEEPRLDIALSYQDKDLLYSGFNFEILLSDEDITVMQQEGICLFSMSKKYGTKKIFNYSATEIKPFLLNIQHE